MSNGDDDFGDQRNPMGKKNTCYIGTRYTLEEPMFMGQINGNRGRGDGDTRIGNGNTDDDIRKNNTGTRMDDHSDENGLGEELEELLTYFQAITQNEMATTPSASSVLKTETYHFLSELKEGLKDVIDVIEELQSAVVELPLRQAEKGILKLAHWDGWVKAHQALDEINEAIITWRKHTGETIQETLFTKRDTEEPITKAQVAQSTFTPGNCRGRGRDPSQRRG